MAQAYYSAQIGGKKMEFSQIQVKHQIEEWLLEDIGGGDITTNNIVPKGAKTKAIIHAKQEGILAGVDIAKLVFQSLSDSISFHACVEDGTKLTKGTIIAEIEGDARAILTGERLALNLLQRMSGVATKTAQFAVLIAGTKARIVDTRKTTPGLRMLEKYAVTVGGGANHRLGLYDAVMIKDNHIKVAGGIKEAIERVRAKIGHTVKVEVEVESMQQLEAALKAKADIIMLDNMSLMQMKEAVERIDGAAIVEASGGITESTIADIAKTGVDIISSGALTHSVKALDISLDIGAIK